MEYTGKWSEKYSEQFGEVVYILEHKSESKVPYCDCSRCGKPIIRKMFVVQSKETDIELAYLGSCCIKKLA